MQKLSQIGISRFHLDLTLDSGVIFSIYSEIIFENVNWSPNSGTIMPAYLFNAFYELLETEISILEIKDEAISLKIFQGDVHRMSVLNDDGYESYFKRTLPR